MITTIIFDCFGVLQIDAAQSFLDQHPDKRKELLEIRDQADRGVLDRPQVLNAFAQICTMDASEVEAVLMHEHAPNVALFKVISKLRNNGYKIGMLSNLGRGWFQDLFPETEVQQLFDDILVSGDVRMAKPQPEIYTLSLQRLGVKAEEVLFVDDREENCSGARAVGMRAYRYKELQPFLQELASLGITLS